MKNRQLSGGISIEQIRPRFSQAANFCLLLHEYHRHITSGRVYGGLQKTKPGGMVMCKRLFAAIAALSLFSGCAIHPVPEDVTGVDTYHIVRQIRCETRDALRQMLIEWLENDLVRKRGDPIALAIVNKYREDPESIRDFSPKLFPGDYYGQVRNLINTFADAGIAYNFELTMTENNDLSGGANFLKPLFSGQFTLGVSAGATRERKNDRTFTVTDTFSFLVTKMKPSHCERQIVGPNYIYPIAGQIGVYKSVRTFVELTLFGNLAGEKADPGTAGAPTMADQLTFTTTVEASATPKVEFTPAGTKFQIMDASLTAAVKRSDVHQVTIGFAITNKGLAALDPLRGYIFARDRGGDAASEVRKVTSAQLFIGNRVTGGGTPAERLAVVAVDQLKRRELQLIVNP